MPFGSKGIEELTGLALSGGGSRATLFHLGTRWRPNELGFLPKLDRVSSVSGGSITAGVLASRCDAWTFTAATRWCSRRTS
jgi:NTE family protein